MRVAVSSLAALSALLLASSAHATTRTVGNGKTYAKPCEAIAAAQPGDVIEVDAAGNYDGDHCGWTTDNLTIRGVNGRAKIDAHKDPSNTTAGKGIFVISAPNATIEHFELAGASVADGNGAGIRHQGTNLTVRDCYFHDNENGILGSPPNDGAGEVLVEGSEFYKNGLGDGYTHNMYLGKYGKFTLQHSYTHSAIVGHLIKSRAYVNYILYNRITDEADGSASYEVNLPAGGLSFVIGNLIQQSPSTQNPAIIDYGDETPRDPDLHLFVVNNTIVNGKGSGTFVQNATDVPSVLMNNIFAGGGTVTTQDNAVLTTNFTDDAKLADASSYDYHLLAGSPCIDKGTDPGLGSGQSLLPAAEYDYPLSSKPRVTVGKIDIGAYEFGNPGTVSGGGAEGGAGGGGGSPDAAKDAPPSATLQSGDLGGTDASSDASGCGCRVHPGSARFAPLAALGAAALLLRRRRRAH